ncbi:MAG: ribonuclease III, partial [Chlamydiia bacterium]|nr:ribonuclease III [Chlamydiia bacterium]
VEEGGPEHAKIFYVHVFLNGQEMGRGEGNSKKEAEQKAAFDALSKIGNCV